MKKTAGIPWISRTAWGALVLLLGLLLNSCEAAFIDGCGSAGLKKLCDARSGGGGGGGTQEFISIWDITKTGARNDNKIKLPLVSTKEGGSYDFHVDWGDGSSNTITSWNAREATHDYTTSNVPNKERIVVRITGTFEGWRFVDDPNPSDAADLLNTKNIGDAPKLIGITQWGSMKLGKDIDSHFAGAANLETFPPGDKPGPDLTGKTSLKNAFHNASSFNGDISNWDVSSIEDMSYMFANARAFNRDISGWNVSKVRDMSYMFARAKEFINDSVALDWNNIGEDTSVTEIDMTNMFFGAEKFNQDISEWNVSKVTNMSNMFTQAYAFNQNISKWVVGMVRNMSGMFNDAEEFNQDISKWNVGMVTDMSNMFNGAKVFNQNISGWDVNKVTNYSYIFEGCPIEEVNKPQRFR